MLYKDFDYHTAAASEHQCRSRGLVLSINYLQIKLQITINIHAWSASFNLYRILQLKQILYIYLFSTHAEPVLCAQVQN